MKKLSIIVGLLLIAFVSYSQFTEENSNYFRRDILDSLDMAEIAGADTALYFRLTAEDGFSMEIDFTTFDTDGDTLIIGASNDTRSYEDVALYNLSTGSTAAEWPLSKTTYTTTYNGVTNNRIALTGVKWYFGYMWIYISASQATEGKLYWKIHRLKQ